MDPKEACDYFKPQLVRRDFSAMLAFPRPTANHCTAHGEHMAFTAFEQHPRRSFENPDHVPPFFSTSHRAPANYGERVILLAIPNAPLDQK
ncbi:hypothetical protein AJ78_06767 [Emergomyces pasteurianus Ep9510]|uniref:Uncharacterized protein n=1 Tax=Emergomyces pasteurianus Ep9510 TaxID=1447872 RepID=A0A1J9P7R7_9EURO|nr:hypothetical protein AJ78_06767 [Emergomyces pasteurianus Ep9510]